MVKPKMAPDKPKSTKHAPSDACDFGGTVANSRYGKGMARRKRLVPGELLR
jgi:hypothetical protein